VACLRQLAQREAAEVCEYAMSLAKNAGDKEISGGSESLIGQFSCLKTSMEGGCDWVVM
jgi:hypothetical protein